jgi:DNA-binding LacI/PurR family transcriptional regulator/DNA-binding transcriptional regulator YhcF (GntR family)
MPELVNLAQSQSSSQALPEPWTQLSGRGSAALAASLKRLIRNGLASAGEPLPSERALSLQLGVSRNAIRAALNELERDGLVRSDSTRVRRVMDTNLRPVLQHTIALVDTRPVNPVQAVQHPGWPTYVHMAALGRLQEQGYQALSCAVLEGNRSALDRLISAKPSGALLPFDIGQSPHAQSVLTVLQRASVPVVVHCDLSVSDGLGDCVCTDHCTAGRLLAQAVVERGCRRIVRLYGGSSAPWLQQRDAGFEQALRDTGREVLPPVLMAPLPVALNAKTSDEFELGVRLMAGYLAPLLQADPQIDAVLGVTDGDATRIAAAARLLGRRPGEDLCICGYDNNWRTSPFRPEGVHPTLTIDKHYDQIGHQMADLMLARLSRSGPDTPVRQVVIPSVIEISPATPANVLSTSPTPEE